ncbi:MAG: flagellar biosynthesis anti-sigma factor FlgM [Deltaproteobacteria bacterium]|jgi:flagellar biosynthesis anti-sigma factor FlgM|nr:flagellar biosynthesis anti-sigma factor FlgM [Deltaproteobacteria bacterium]
MKIDPNAQPLKINRNEVQPGSSGSDKTSAETYASETTASAQSDKVNISERSRLIAKARELATLAPDTRSEKVAELTAKIASGSYQVSSEQVADSIIKKSFYGIF